MVGDTYVAPVQTYKLTGEEKSYPAPTLLSGDKGLKGICGH